MHGPVLSLVLQYYHIYVVFLIHIQKFIYFTIGYWVDRGFEPRLGQTKDYKIGMCCFSAKHAALRKKSKNNNVSEWSDMSIRGLLFQ